MNCYTNESSYYANKQNTSPLIESAKQNIPMGKQTEGGPHRDLPSMRSGAGDAKAEVWVEEPVPPNPRSAFTLAAGPSPSGWARSGRGHPSNPAIASAPRNTTPKVSRFARFQHGGPHTSGHTVQVELTSSFSPGEPGSRQAAPTHLCRARAPLPTKSSAGIGAMGGSPCLLNQTFALEGADSSRCFRFLLLRIMIACIEHERRVVFEEYEILIFLIFFFYEDKMLN